MDTGPLASAPIFVVLLLLFPYLSLTERVEKAERGVVEEGRAWNLASVLRTLKYACLIGASLSGLALVFSIGSPTWWLIAILSLALLMIFSIIERACATLADRYPALVASWCLPLRRPRQPSFNRSPTPAEGGVTGYGRGPEPSAGNDTAHDNMGISEEELVSLDQRDRQMLRSILELDVTTAREIMIPRLDITAVEVNTDLFEVAERVVHGGHSRLPVYEETIDHVVGILHSRDLVASLAQHRAVGSLRELLRPAYFIPESKRLDDLLEEMREKSVQMAIVVDEYGGTEGLVTMEDLLEEIVGEIEDEFSTAREPRVVRLPDGAVMVDAGVTIEQVEELFSTRIDSEDVDTVGGYVYRMLGRIPMVGDAVVTDHLRIEVALILGRRLRKLRISRPTGHNLDSIQ